MVNGGGTIEAKQVWIDDERLGAGCRLFLLMIRGYRNVTLFDWTTLRHKRVSISSVRIASDWEPKPMDWRRISRSIKRKRKLWKKMGIRFNTRIARLAEEQTLIMSQK